MIEKARKEVPARRSSPPAAASDSSEFKEAEVAQSSSKPRNQIDAKAKNQQSPSLDSGREYLQVRIRVQYDNACWIVDYTKPVEHDGTLCLVSEGGDRGLCFASIAAMRLQSVERA
ncbi:MAG TPA: hypothetical protein VN693_00965 [Rhodanobacteraceae bacterium]|nr:hypothetical protein [Rhodanobacteraceae bacterium]